MKNIIKAIFITPLVFLCFLAPVKAEGVVQNIEGFPIMAGFVEDAAAAVFFDKAEGRVIEGAILGDATVGAALDFYKENMVQIGWDLGGASVSERGVSVLLFHKEGESLTLEFEQEGAQLEIRFFLIPSTPF